MANDHATGAAADCRHAETKGFGERVRELRECAGLTLVQLADKSGVSRAMFSKAERGEQSPTIGLPSALLKGWTNRFRF